MEAPEKVYLTLIEDGLHCYTEEIPFEREYIEYTRKDAFIEKATNFLNNKLGDVVATRVPGTIIPYHVAKQEVIEELKRELKK